MATIGDLLNEFCDRINQPRESAYVTGTTPAARQYVSLFKYIGDKLLEYPDGWSQLKRIYTFTSVTGQAYYQLPGDFHRFLYGTQWDATNQIPLAGPLSDARLAFQTYGVNIATPFAGWQVNGAQGYVHSTDFYNQRSAGRFQVSPAGQNSSTSWAVAYVSRNYVWPTSWVVGQTYALNVIRSGINNIYIVVDAITSSTTRPSVVQGDESDGDGVWQAYFQPYALTADTDIFVLDDDLMVEGMRWAWYEAKQQFSASSILKAEWEKSVKSAIGRQNGATVINAGYDVTASWDWPIVPVGDWSI